MKNEHQTETRYYNAEPLHSNEIGERPLFFSRVVFPEWQKDRVTCQSLLEESGTIWQRTKAEPQPLTPEEEHLARVDAIKGLVSNLSLHHINKGAITYYLEKNEPRT